MGKSVCIIGAGPAGLACLRNILLTNSKENDFSKLRVKVFEQSNDIGGVWNFPNGNNNLGEAETAMYRGLRTNLPKEIMRFLGFGSENYDGVKSFVTQADVLEYLKKYAEMYGLKDFIEFNRRIMRVTPIPGENSREPRWSVEVENVVDPSEKVLEEFDAVMVCNGHHNRRKFPDNYEEIKAKFQGTMLHSLDYEGPESFLDKNVMVVGGGPSGVDVAIGISGCAKQVYLCTRDMTHRTLSNMDSLTNFRQTGVIQLAKERSVILATGEEIFCDVIIFCTGYEHEFPFLEKGIVEIKENGKQVTPLFLHMIHMKYTTLSFIGLPHIADAFLMFDCQSLYYISYLLGKLVLPTESEMEEHFENDRLQRIPHGMDGVKSHILHFMQWPYFRYLGEKGGFLEEINSLLPMFEKAYHGTIQLHYSNPMNYRELDFDTILNSA